MQLSQKSTGGSAVKWVGYLTVVGVDLFIADNVTAHSDFLSSPAAWLLIAVMAVANVLLIARDPKTAAVVAGITAGIIGIGAVSSEPTRALAIAAVVLGLLGDLLDPKVILVGAVVFAVITLFKKLDAINSNLIKLREERRCL